MKITARDLKDLLMEMSDEAKYPINESNKDLIAEILNSNNPNPEITGRWIIDKWREVGSGRSHLVSARPAILDKIAGYLDYSSFSDFSEGSKVDKKLNLLDGNWRSYLRDSSKSEQLISSPVRITCFRKDATFELKGPSRTFSGKLNVIQDSLFVLLSYGLSKQFHHVYKLGNILSPKALIGVYSGISSHNIPIAGFVLLIRLNSKESPKPPCLIKKPGFGMEKEQAVWNFFFDPEIKTNVFRANPEDLSAVLTKNEHP